MKLYRDNPQIGKCRHSVSFHDGVQAHKDGSPFFDLQTFKRRPDKEAFIKALIRLGFKEECWNTPMIYPASQTAKT